jgi:glycosyltransferase involved in cell wall biosynthesis
MRATFVFPNPRARLIAGVAARTEPDSALFGANHLSEHGIDVRVHDPLLTRRQLPTPLDRVAWNVRELTVPFEVGRTSVVVTPLAAALPLAGRARRLPVVVVNYGLNLIWNRASGFRRRILGASLRSAARVVCLGESQRSELVDAAGLDPDRVLTMLVPIDDEFFTPVPERGEIVLSVGKDLARDYRTLLEAVTPLDVQTRLVAHPRNLQGLTLPASAEAADGLPSAALRELYARAACVVVPQHRDGFPYGSEAAGLTALLEAMAMGKAVVATDRAILHDYVEDGVDALLVPPGDPAALRTAVERVLGDAELAGRLGAAARARVERAHTTRGFAAQLEPLLRALGSPR